MPAPVVNLVPTGTDPKYFSETHVEDQINGALAYLHGVANPEDRDRAEDAADAAASSAAAALISQTTALAAANAAGPTVIYATKTLADAALAGLSNGTVIEVGIDESRGGRRTRYRKTAGSYVFELDLTGRRTIYVKSAVGRDGRAMSGGDDANDGLTAATPKATLAAAIAALANGDELSLCRERTWRETLNTVGKSGIRITSHGSGRRPLVSGLDIVTTFTINGAGPAYNFDVTLEQGFVDRAYPGVFENGRRLREYRIAADGITDNAGVIAAVQANPGSFGFLSWATNPTSGSPGAWTAGTKTYIVHATGGGNPNSNGSTYEVYKRVNVVQCGQDTLISDIVFHHGWRHEVADINDCIIQNCAFLHQARHGTLPPHRIAIRNTLNALSNPQYPGALFHLQATTAGVTEPFSAYENLVGIGDPATFAAFGLYNHGIADPTARIAGLKVNGARIENVQTVYEFGVIDNVDITNLVARNFSICGGNCGTVGRIVNGDWRTRVQSATARRQWSIPSGATVRLIRPYVDVAENSLFRRETGSGMGTIEIEGGTLIVRPVTIASDLVGLVLTETENTHSIARLKITDAVVYANGPLLSRVSSVGSLEINRVLVIGHGGARGADTVTIGGVTSRISGVAGGGRVITISDAKAVASADINGGLQLRRGVYSPGDEIFAGIVGGNFADQPRGNFAVGDAIYSSDLTNFGGSWTRRASPDKFMRAVCISGDKVIAVGDDGEIWRTTDGFGQTWVEVTGTSITADLLGVAARSTGVLIAVGDGGVIYRSTDSGATWASITSPTSRTMRAVVSNGDTWVAAGDEGRVIRSTDNGLTWTEATVGTAAHHALTRFNSLFLLGSDPVLGSTALTSNIRTSSDGTTWTERANGIPNRVSCFAATPEGLVAGLYQTSAVSAASFMTSTDGTTWVVENTVLPFEVTGIAASGVSGRFDNAPVIAVGESAHAAVRRANGQAWDIRRVNVAYPGQMATGVADVIAMVG